MISALIDLKRGDHEGLVVQLTSRLRSLIATGRLGKGRVLPSSRRLANDLGVSRNTVTYAFEQLAAEGYLAASHGRRPVVTVDGGGHGDGVEAARSAARSARPTLSPWAMRLKQADWPLSYQAPFKPLRPGHGDAREFPNDVWARCLRRSAVHAARREVGPVNRPRLCEALAHYLATSRGVRASAGQILILPSAQAALTLIAAVLIAPGDEVRVEDPGYPGAAAAFHASGACVTGMRLDEQGMQWTSGMTAPKLIFMTPSHQHPTGRLMSLARRTEFLRASRPGKTWIVEDDYDGEFHYDSRPVPALQGLDTHGRVFYVGTFSKAMTSDLRLGYLVVPPALVGTFEIAQRHVGLIASSHIQEALAEFIADGHFLAHLRRVRRLYHARRDHLAEGLERHLGEVLTAEVPSGGIQLVARLKRGRADRAAVKRLVEAGVVTRALSSLALNKPRDHGLLLGFAAWRESEISAALRTMTSCF
ncbi:PLP-dependent aminotransferase family protein [Bradyrhizobium sp. Y36]|uniref:MocR-like pyridoxine biosynthesis transcription factor PdxR n=1 Tax=Bradyrhizobium sp. Y36 TaxID=2035447 RepID=UPI0018EA088F|nr:PLP-dependent aminotransferase family protein [Bradyrhizobium sp. Y36]